MTQRVIAVCAVAASLLCITGATHSAERTTTQEVLIVDDSDPDSPLSRELREQIHLTLDTEVPTGYKIHAEFLNSGHLNERDYDLALHAYVKEKFRNHELSAIVTIGLVSLDFAVRLRSELWPDLLASCRARPPPPALRGHFAETKEVPKNLTVEHVLPQTWQEYWPLPEGVSADARNRTLHSIGNLSLVNERLNPYQSNRPWLDGQQPEGGKRVALEASSVLYLNKRLCEYPNWDEKTIAARAEELFGLAGKIWPR